MVYSRHTEKILSFVVRTSTRLGSGNTGFVRKCYGSIEPAYPDDPGGLTGTHPRSAEYRRPAQLWREIAAGRAVDRTAPPGLFDV